MSPTSREVFYGIHPLGFAPVPFRSPCLGRNDATIRCSVWRSPTVMERRPMRITSSFSGVRLRSTKIAIAAPQKVASVAKSCVTKMIVDPWSVSPEAVDALAAQFFAASLFPYLGFLYYLGRDEVKCPKLANFGFRFLLVFVFATIPAGIYAKVHYHDILANIDWLHGGAESLLTITNLLIVLGFRGAMTPNVIDAVPTESAKTEESPMRMNSTIVPALITSLGSFLSLAALGSLHVEPANALSFPTWVIHVSSLVEWLVAMGLVWKYAEVTDNPAWKGLTWGMLPLHTSGICACTYHLFYNAPSLNILVALQAALTFFGNGTLVAAAYRISRSEKKTMAAHKSVSSQSEKRNISLVGFEDLAVQLQQDSNAKFLLKLFGISCVGSALVKWGSLAIDAPFEPTLALSLSIIVIPTVLNMAKWAVRSNKEMSDFGGFL